MDSTEDDKMPIIEKTDVLDRQSAAVDVAAAAVAAAAAAATAVAATAAANRQGGRRLSPTSRCHIVASGICNDPLCHSCSSLIILQRQVNAQISYIDQCVGVNIPTSLRTLFIAGEMAGIGMLTAPWASINLNWIGFVLLLVVGIMTVYSGNILGKCWAIVYERYYQCRVFPCESPYRKIAEIAVGKKNSCIATACIQTTLFGAATVYLMLLAQLAQKLFATTHPEIDFSTWLFIFAIVLSSLMFLEDPRDFRLVAVGTMLTAMSACFLVILQILMDSRMKKDPAKHHTYEWDETQFFLSFGTILFAFGGASAFPTIQNERYKKNEFSVSVITFFTILAFLFGIVVTGGYIVYGDDINQNILLTLGNSWFSHLAIILVMIHLVLGFIITVNPISQHFEKFLSIPDAFGFKRFMLRLGLLLGMLFLGQCIEKFSILVALIGTTTIAFTTFVLPPLFYIRLCAMRSVQWRVRHISWQSKLLMHLVITAGLMCIIFAISTAVYHILDLKTLVIPYYVSFFSTEK